jgi:hypothetical protein
MKCLLCAGTGETDEDLPETDDDEIARQSVALITLALDHAIAGDGEAFTLTELISVAGNRPLSEMPPLLAAVSSIAAHVLRHTADGDDSARDWWSRIAQNLLSEDD